MQVAVFPVKRQSRFVLLPLVLSGVTAILATTAALGQALYTLPADRATTWKPGVTYNGGIPSRTTVCASLAAGASVSAIQSALDACPAGQVVSLAAGSYTVNSTLLVPSNVTLRGAGPGSTILRKTNGAVAGVDGSGSDSSPIIIVGPARWGNNPHGVAGATNLTADAAKGAYSITVASTAGLSVGQLVLLDELSKASWQTDPNNRGKIWASADFRVAWQLHMPAQPTDDPLVASDPTGGDAASWFCRQGRPTGEMKVITAISGNTVTFSTPIHISYRTANVAQLARFEYPKVVGAGVESLSMTGGSDGSLRFHWTDSSWAKDVEISTWAGEGIAIDNSFRTEIRHSYVHDAAYASPGGIGYAISLSAGSADVLIEDNIVVRANKVMVARSAGAGSVVGYNYMDMGYIVYNPDWQEIGVNGSHMVGPHHMLFEGNYTFNLDSDKTHGNSVYQTYFRNYATGYRASFTTQSKTINDRSSSAGPLRTAGPASLAYWFTFVGNVLGTPGAMNGWVYEGNIMLGGPAVWAPGWDDWTPQTPMDANVVTSLLRDGNYDYLTNQVHWHGIGGSGSGNGLTPPAASTLPNSLYLSGKPSFFGANTWPWVDATGTTKLYTLPAKARYDAGTPFAQAAAGPTPKVPTNLVIQ